MINNIINSVNDEIQDREHDDRVWKYEVLTNMCEDLESCEMQNSNEYTEKRSNKTYAQMDWHDASIWQSHKGPHWTDSEGKFPGGVPTKGAHVVIPEGKPTIIVQQIYNVLNGDLYRLHILK